MLKKQVCQAEIKLKIKLIDPMLIRAGYSAAAGPDMTPVLTWRNGEAEPFIPGTSLKGMIRSYIEKICRTLIDQSVCEPYDQKHACNSKIDADLTTAEIYASLCPTCRMFGSLHFAGRCSISDAYMQAGSRYMPEPRNGVAIDRYTGGTVPKALFDYEVVAKGTLDCHISLRNFEIYQLGLLAFALRDMGEGLLRIGSGKSRGLGRFETEIEAIDLMYYGKNQSTLAGLGECLSENERQQYGLKLKEGLPAIAGEYKNQIYKHAYQITGDQIEMLLANAAESVPELLFKGARL